MFAADLVYSVFIGSMLALALTSGVRLARRALKALRRRRVRIPPPTYHPCRYRPQHNTQGEL